MDDVRNNLFFGKYTFIYIYLSPEVSGASPGCKRTHERANKISEQFHQSYVIITECDYNLPSSTDTNLPNHRQI